MASQINEGLIVRGGLSADRITYPSGLILNQHVATDAGIAATKLVTRRIATFAIEPATDVTAQNVLMHYARAAGTLVYFGGFVVTKATGDKAAAVGFTKSTGAGSFSSVLDSNPTFNSSSSNLIAQEATFTTAEYVAGDIFRIEIALGGSTGNQNKGLFVMAIFDEAAN